MKNLKELGGWAKTELEPLRQQMGSINVVCGCGPQDARLMLVGEAPGQNEDEEDMPFVGRSGDLLNRLLLLAKLDRDKIYITNAVKCRPITPNGRANRTPTELEIKKCKGVLWKEIQLIRPKIIVTLGAIPTSLLLKVHKGFKMGDHVGTPILVDYLPDSSIMPIWHPSFLLRSKIEYFNRAADMFRQVRELLDEDTKNDTERLARDT